MNKKLTLILLLIIFQTSLAQDCNFKIQEISNTLNGQSELIEESEYKNVARISDKFIELEPKSELELTKKYPEIFKPIDSCYRFSTNQNTGIKAHELKACRNKVQTKEYSDYKFKGIYCGNALIEIIGYESWGFLSVDLNNGVTCFTMGKPLTSKGDTAISYSNYYGGEEIALTDLQTKKQYIIGIEGWRTIDSKTSKNTYYLKLESEFQTNCKKEIKYLKVNNY